SHDTALRSFDEALRLQPNSPELRQYVDFLRQRESEFEDLFRREASPIVAAALGKGSEQSTDATRAAADSDAPAHILLELEAIRLHTDGTTKLFSQNLIKILNHDGVRRYDAFSTYYAPGEQVVEFKVARVHHVDGRVSNAELSRFSGEATEDAQYEPATIDLPPLAAGDVVEVEYVREQVQQSFFGDYFGHREVFQKALPVDEKTFILQVQDGRKVNFHGRNLNVKPTTSRDANSKTKTYRWTLHDIPKLETEPGMPPSTEVSPVLEMSTFATWREFSTWYYNLIRKQFESNPEIRRKVLELTSGAEDDLAKIRAVYNFVVTQIRYNMWEFGVHGFKPFNATSIFARRFGDCKDKATLISVMLNEVGIDAYPVLIFGTRARANEDLTLPLVNHFNHCISYVPPSGEHGALYLDGTAQHHSLDDLPSMDRGARVLIVTPDGGDLNEVPWNESSNLSLEEETTIVLSDDLSADFHTRVSVKGDYAVYIRNAFEIKGQRSVQLERLFSRRFAASSVESQEFSKLDDLNQPVTFVARLKVPRFVTESSTGLVLRAERDFFSTCTQLTALSSLEERKFDLLLGNPRVSALRTIYRLPPTLGLKSLPPAREMTTTFGRFSINYTAPEPQQIVVERQIEITSPRVSIDTYEAFREFAAALKRLEDQQILLTRN
ncbi:MAG: DUF3857 and transglutaminase domain-containing protein, partial [Planctomycetes bacterium]|nr:DUF3857 and transglutaminase domain-containing protein [Planctomycetota bacterium]